MIRKLHEKLINKEISAKELTEDYLNKIKNKNTELNAFITISEKLALEQADRVDELIARGEDIPFLAGVPVSIKDVIMTEGIQTTAGSQILKNYIAPYDATLVKKLKEHGAVILGKNNCDEFAMGGSGENSGFGPTKNPHDLTRVPGGSSSGSATAVAADLSVYAIGTDTGGSVRQPATFCGVVGFKPTYGTVSRYGLIAMASSLDQAGIISKSVEDIEIIFNTIKGKDRLDSTSLEFPISNFQFPNKLQNLNSKFKNIKIGIPKEYFLSGLDKEIETAVKTTITKAQELGAKIVEVSLPNTEYALAVYYIIMPSEVSANLARFDAVRYGQKQDADNLFDVYAKSRAKYLGDEVKRRIMLGTYALSAGYYDAYYKKAQQVRTLIKQDFYKVFEEIDFLITPTTPTSAFKLGEKTQDPLQMYLEDIFTVPVNVAGLPAVSIPCGKTQIGLPIGVQLIGNWLKDTNLLAVAKILESVLKYTEN
ncbi:MAG: Asp-tRNA(Asn)/Glu-tRNA(Gln) amidotransferase subunit GatA [Patescibacteria group bacterium]